MISKWDNYVFIQINSDSIFLNIKLVKIELTTIKWISEQIIVNIIVNKSNIICIFKITGLLKDKT